ncbi:MAG TPA: RNA methyltransferase [Acidimicrobiia bacterium]|nr:RNA methyltransferase [Acidimicrobiia bacterium]
MGFDITSPSNERIKWLVRLRERKHRDAEGVLVVEGERLYSRALAADLKPVVTFVSDSSAMASGEVVTVTPDVLDKASYRSRSEGLVGVFRQPATGLDTLSLGAQPLILILENIEKPGNLGAMCRTAAAARVDAVIAIGHGADPWNPNALRASTGAVFSVGLAVSDWDALEPWLTERGVTTVAASPEATTSLYDTDMGRPIAVVIGAEDQGLSERARSIASELVSIPQAHGTTDSLNASVAAGIVLFEVARQRTG